jgi:hypothetical protein
MILNMAVHSLLLDEVFAFTIPKNLRSIRVMEKLGMIPREPLHFDRPGVNDPNCKQHLLFYSVNLRIGLGSFRCLNPRFHMLADGRGQAANERPEAGRTRP